MSESKKNTEIIRACENPLGDLPITLGLDGRLIIPDGMPIHHYEVAVRRVEMFKEKAKAFSRQLQEYGESEYGLDQIVPIYEQIFMDLGKNLEDKQDDLNPRDKSRNIVTIEGVSRSFTAWFSKMGPDIPTWNKTQLSKALTLLEPIEAQAKRLRGMLDV